MRILFVSRFFPYVGGSEVMVFTIAEGLSKSHHIGIATPDVGFVSENYEVMNYSNSDEFEKIIDHFEPDVINSHTFYLTPDVLRICTLKKIPVILTLHGDILNSSRPEDRQMFLDFTDDLTYIITVSQHGKIELIKHGFEEKNITTIINGIDIYPYSTKIDSKSSLRTLFGLPLKETLFITPARMTYHKGLEFLLRTLKRFKDDRVIFLISTPSGDYQKKESRHIKYTQRLMYLIEKWELTNIVKIQYHDISDMPSLYQASDCLILPSKSGEQIPISVLEAMASRIPVIATNIAGLPEIIQDGYSGFLIAYDDEEMLSERIHQIIRGDHKLEDIKRKAYQTVKEKFSSQRMIKQYEDLLSLMKNEPNGIGDL